MTATTNHEDATGVVIPETRTPRISDLVPGAVILRWATTHTFRLVSELPCHADQMASVRFSPKMTIEVDQAVVCRRCFATYAATPLPGTADFAWYRIMYRYIGPVTLSHSKRVGE